MNDYDIILIPVIHILVFLMWIFFLIWNKNNTLSKYLSIKYIGFDRTIVIPIIVTLLATAVFPKISYDFPMIYRIIVWSLTGPIAEEIIFRGFFIGFIGFGLVDTFNKLKININLKKIFSHIWIIFIVISSNLLFILNHNRGFNIPLIIHAVIYTTFYLINKKNLAPSMVAHIINNLSIGLIG